MAVRLQRSGVEIPGHAGLISVHIQRLISRAGKEGPLVSS